MTLMQTNTFIGESTLARTAITEAEYAANTWVQQNEGKDGLAVSDIDHQTLAGTDTGGDYLVRLYTHRVTVKYYRTLKQDRETT